MKEEIVQKFLNKGKLLTPRALDMLSKDDTEALFIDGYTDVVVDENDVTDNIKKSVQTQEEFKILKNLTAKKQEITPDDFARFYRSKYEKMKNILVEKTQKPFTSLNKLSNYRDEVYVVGIIRDIKERGDKKILDIEDMSGSTSVIFDKEVEAELDDVVAIKAVSSKNVIFGKQIIYPDVPLRKPTTGQGKACFVGGLKINEAPTSELDNFFMWVEKQPIRYIFVVGDVGDLFEFERRVEKYCHDKKVFFVPGTKDVDEEYPQMPVKFNTNKIVSLSNPAMVNLKDLKILLMHKFDISMLKKRYLGKSSVVLDEDYLVLEEVPDVVCYGQSEVPHVTNYKSITIVSSGSMLATFRPVIIDFETREVQQIDLRTGRE